MNKSVFVLVFAAACAAAVGHAAGRPEVAPHLNASARAAGGEAIDPIMGKPVSELTEEDKAVRRQKILEFQGGMIEVEPKGPRFYILDARAATDGVPAKVAKAFGDSFKIGVEAVADRERSAADLAADAKVLAVVRIEDGAADAPALAIYPEERVAVVNCARLDGADGARFARRLERELWRAICFVGGTGYSASRNSLVQPIFTMEELDAIESKGVNMTTISQFGPLFGKYGVKKGSKVSYRNAVRQGWAPEPTNDLQRAVWEDEKARMAERNASADKAANAE